MIFDGMICPSTAGTHRVREMSRVTACGEGRQAAVSRRVSGCFRSAIMQDGP